MLVGGVMVAVWATCRAGEMLRALLCRAPVARHSLALFESGAFCLDRHAMLMLAMGSRLLVLKRGLLAQLPLVEMLSPGRLVSPCHWLGGRDRLRVDVFLLLQ